MLVRALTGRMAGQVIEMEYAAARDALLSKAVEYPDAAVKRRESANASLQKLPKHARRAHGA